MAVVTCGTVDGVGETGCFVATTKTGITVSGCCSRVRTVEKDGIDIRSVVRAGTVGAAAGCVFNFSVPVGRFGGDTLILRTSLVVIAYLGSCPFVIPAFLNGISGTA